MSVLADLFNVTRRRSRNHSGWVGVDVGTAALKLAEVERRGRSFRLVRSAIIPRPARAESETPAGALSASDWIGEALRQHLAGANPFSGRTAACVLSMSATPLRMMEFPPGTPEEHREMAANEFGEAVDSAGRRQTVGCWPACGSGKDGLVPVYALAADEETAVNVAEDLWEAGLRTHVLDGLPFALARGIGLAAPDDVNVPVAALDWGHSTATFVVALDGRPAFARVLRDCGLRFVIQAVATGFGLSLEEAGQLLVEFGMPDAQQPASSTAPLQSTVREVAAEPLNRLVDELERTVDFLASQGTGLSPRRMWLSGGGAMVANMAPWLTAASGIPVEPWRLAGVDAANAGTMPLLGAAAALSMLGGEA